MSEFHLHNMTDPITHDDAHCANHPHHQKGDIQENKKSNQNALKIIMSLTLIFALVEALGGWFSHSLALFSDSFHMLTDSAALFLALCMAKLSEKPADQQYSYGHGRADTIGAFFNSFFMLLIILFLIYESIHRLLQPQNVHASTIIFIASIGLVVNMISFFMLHDKHSLNTKAAFIHIIGDLLGTIATIVAGILIYYTHYSFIDPLLSLIISLIMVPSTYLLFKKSIHILMEGVPEHLNYEDIGKSLIEIHGVASIHDLHIWTMNSDSVCLSSHICIEDMRQWDNILIQCQAMLSKKHHINHVTLQPELVMNYLIKKT